MIEHKKRKRRTKAEMAEAKATEDIKGGEPKGYKSLCGKRINYNNQRVEIITHYYDGRIEIQTKEGKIIPFKSLNALKEA